MVMECDLVRVGDLEHHQYAMTAVAGSCNSLRTPSGPCGTGLVPPASIVSWSVCRGYAIASAPSKLLLEPHLQRGLDPGECSTCGPRCCGSRASALPISVLARGGRRRRSGPACRTVPRPPVRSRAALPARAALCHRRRQDAPGRSGQRRARLETTPGFVCGFGVEATEIDEPRAGFRYRTVTSTQHRCKRAGCSRPTGEAGAAGARGSPAAVHCPSRITRALALARQPRLDQKSLSGASMAARSAAGPCRGPWRSKRDCWRDPRPRGRCG